MVEHLISKIRRCRFESCYGIYNFNFGEIYYVFVTKWKFTQIRF